MEWPGTIAPTQTLPPHMKRRDFLRFSGLGAAGGIWSPLVPGSAAALERMLDEVLPVQVTAAATDGGILATD